MASLGRALRWLAVSFALVGTTGLPIAASALDVAGTCTVQFFATSSLHDFEGEAPCALLEIEPPDASGHYAARAEIAIAQIDTGISARNKKMRETFEAQKYPRIVASFKQLDPAALRARAPGALPFRLAMHGVERTVTPAISRFSEDPSKRARFRASFELSLKDFGLEPPLGMGFLRVGDAVRVVVDVELRAKNGPRE